MSATAAQQATDEQTENWQLCSDLEDNNTSGCLEEIRLYHMYVYAKRPRVAEAGSDQTVVGTWNLSGRIDHALDGIPGAGPFRRANSFTAHPTTQGVTLRPVGGNAAGRALVTLDGIPQNDPFGGWVYWSSYSSFLEGVRVRKGGTGGAFGAQALTGVAEIVPIMPFGGGTTPAYEAGLTTKLVYGNQGTKGAEARADILLRRTDIAIEAGYLDSEGDYLLSDGQRGPVDARAASDSRFLSFAVDSDLAGISIQARARVFEENRINGLSLAENRTSAQQYSLRLQPALVTLDTVVWELTTYYQKRDFANVFASARDDRTTERAVLDQFDVPAWGAGVLARVQFSGFELGIDGRRMSGETNERFRNLGAGFTRQRRAGGDQWTLGFYGEYSHDADWGAVSATLRYDRWRTYGGVRDEFNIENGFPGFASPDRSDLVPNRKGGEWTGRVGFERALTGAIDLRAAAYKTWRLPTLNEYYRPFRVVNDITEANPNLTPETLYGLEVGFDYEPLNTVKLSATYYRNWLKNGVGNVTIGFGPGFFPLGGFVPDGGVLRQRTNVDESITDGIEFDAELILETNWTLSASYLYARARITKFDAMPELVGKRPVQTPKHSLSANVAYFGGKNWSIDVGGSYSSAQFDDDLNARRLGGIFVVNAGGRYHVSDKIQLTVQADNLFDAKVVSAVTADGLETLAQRRFWRIGLEASF